jgi:hypothetical protein
LQLNQSEYDGTLSPVVKLGLIPHDAVHCEYASPQLEVGGSGSAAASCGKTTNIISNKPNKKITRLPVLVPEFGIAGLYISHSTDGREVRSGDLQQSLEDMFFRTIANQYLRSWRLFAIFDYRVNFPLSP